MKIIYIHPVYYLLLPSHMRREKENDNAFKSFASSMSVPSFTICQPQNGITHQNHKQYFYLITD
jgi:hypothetical protein